MKRLIQNAIITPDGTFLRSLYRHNYVEYIDKLTGKTYMVDGGLDYCRRSAHGDEIDMCLYDDESHTIQRAVLKWGSYGKDGKQPYRLIPIGLMETEHILAVLDECSPSTVYRNCMLAELKERGFNGV